MYNLPFLQEGFAIHIILAHSCCFPGKVCPTGITLKRRDNDKDLGIIIYLEQQRFPGLVPATNEQGDTEGPDAPRLGVLLHDQGNSVHKLGCGDWLMVHQVVILCHLPGSSDEQPVVGAHATVHHPYVVGDLLNLRMNNIM